MSLIGILHKSGQQIYNDSIVLAHNSNHRYLTGWHILSVLIDNNHIVMSILRAGGKMAIVTEEIAIELSNLPQKKNISDTINLDLQLERVFYELANTLTFNQTIGLSLGQLYTSIKTYVGASSLPDVSLDSGGHSYADDIIFISEIRKNKQQGFYACVGFLDKTITKAKSIAKDHEMELLAEEFNVNPIYYTYFANRSESSLIITASSEIRVISANYIKTCSLALEDNSGIIMLKGDFCCMIETDGTFSLGVLINEEVVPLVNGTTDVDLCAERVISFFVKIAITKIVI